ncbi:large ribosomal subunit protein mL66 [Phlebotomus argentipes]|uniref:large ribosomal subunit protein mL66 n=1 Tax=Phlebotomus argentipes TaxID=94469 RepID=UPI002892CED7|nr:large ribosomal subunit protein mL66 [Phlebotomus argentipes]
MSILQSSFTRAIKAISFSINQTVRPFGVTPITQVKEIIKTQDEKNTITIEGQFVKSPRSKFLLKEYSEIKQSKKKFCPKCSLGLDVKHTDVLILSQYVRSDGCMLPRRVTGLCPRQQKKMSILVAMAQKAGLMSNLTPATSRKDPKLRREWRKFNIYFVEEKTKEIRRLRC